jgi:hypothetical protein
MNKLSTLSLALLALVPVLRAQQVPSHEPIPVVTGALLADGFDGPQLDTSVWARPDWLAEHDPYIAVGVSNGRLLISGISHPSGKDHQYVGILSKYFRETDVVLVARIRAQSAYEQEGRLQHMVHLCTGDWPDFFTEIIFGRISGGPPRWYAGYMGRVWDYEGYADYIEPTHPATGNEAVDWHTVVLQHDGITGRTQNYLIVGADWIPIGPTHTLHFNHAHVELKVDVNVAGAQVQMEVDDVRLYLNPAHHPATIVVSSRVAHDQPKLTISNQRVRILEEGAGRLLGEGTTDEGGQARVMLRTDVAYPVAADVEVWNGNTEVFRSKIPGSSVRGLYPGDVWALRTDPTFAMLQDQRTPWVRQRAR